MIFTFLHGALLGLLLSIFVGPIFFVLIKTSIADGFKNAMYMVSGIFLSDLSCIIVCYLGLVEAFTDPDIKKWIMIIGGVILVVTGIVTYLKKKPINEDKISTGGAKEFKLMAKGFLFNISTPTVILFWIGAVGFAVSSYHADTTHVVLYFVGVLGTVVTIDILKAYGASKIRKWFTPKVLGKINKVTGAGIFIFGLIMLIRVYFNK